MQGVTRHPGGIVQLRLPMAGNPMKYVNAYLLKDDDGATLVDCGWKADDVLAALEDGLREAGLRLRDVRRLLVTHTHFDHYGLAGTLRRRGVAELGMHARDAAFARAMLADHVAADRIADDWLEANGLPCMPESDGADEADYYRRTELCEPTRTIADGERVGRLRALHTPGHTPGHLCFVDERTGTMLTGDHVLPRITPHVGMWHPSGTNPLGDYLASLRAVRACGATRVFPAHLEPFDDLAMRVGELLAHHDEREAQLYDALVAGTLTGADVAAAVPWTGRKLAFADLDPWHRQFAVAETLAHLEHLRAGGFIRRDERDGRFRYEISGATRRPGRPAPN